MYKMTACSSIRSSFFSISSRFCIFYTWSTICVQYCTKELVPWDGKYFFGH